MSNTSEAYIKLYQRDLDRLSNELKMLQDKNLWEKQPGVINSVGVLAQHLIGNLHHFIGTQLGKTGYKRNRELEFTDTKISTVELIKQIDELKQVISTVISALDVEDYDRNYSQNFPFEATVNEGLMHLYGHLNYHLGQVNYLRRMIEEKG